MNFLLIGRANVGKSSIFNNLTGNNTNIVHKDKGTTRDWHEGKILTSENKQVYDTPGFDFELNIKKKLKPIKILENIISKIDVFLYVIDYKSIFNNTDNEIIKYLRKYNKEIVLLINKFDNPKQSINNEYYKYAINNVFFISCSHNQGFYEFIDFLKKNYLPNKIDLNKKNEVTNFSLAIFGKPNSGKSTFLNTLLGFERSFTDAKAGTTSDFVVAQLTYKSNNIQIIDTAGIGRQSKIRDNSINFLSTKKSIQQIDKVDVAFILIDSNLGFDRQDKRIVKLVSNQAKNLIIIFNKKDLIINIYEFKKEMIETLELTIHESKNIKIFFCTAFSKKQIFKIMDYIVLNIFNKNYHINTSQLNKWLKNVTIKNEHPRIDNKRVNFKYAVKIKDNPTTIKIFCNFPKKIRKDYRRYLINNFNIEFKIINQNTNFIFSSTQNPYLKI